MGEKWVFTADDCDRFLENIVDQVLADTAEPSKLAVTAYASSSDRVAVLCRAAASVVGGINSQAGQSLDMYYLNLSGYFGHACERHRLPPTMAAGLRYVLLTDNWNDSVLTGHAHNFIAKFGVPHENIRMATVIYPSDVYRHLSIATAVNDKDGRLSQPRLLSTTNIHRRPDYVGCELHDEGQFRPETLELRVVGDSLAIAYHG
jgi:hypothetical protein